MSAKQRITRIASDLTDLETLANLLANPKTIKETAEAARQEVSLTQEQEAKYTAALSLIAKSESLAQALKSREDTLSANIAEHEQDVACFHKLTDAFEQTVQANNAEHQVKERIHAEALAKIADAQKQADLSNQVVDAAMRKREKAAQKAEEDNKRTKEALEAESARLAQLRDSITRKAQLLAQAIG